MFNLILSAAFTEQFQGLSLVRQGQKAVKVSDVKERWHPLGHEPRNWSQMSWSQIPDQLVSNTYLRSSFLSWKLHFLDLFTHCKICTTPPPPFFLTGEIKWLKHMWEHLASYTETEVSNYFSKDARSPPSKLFNVYLYARRVYFLSIMTNQRSSLIEEVRKASLGWWFKSESIDKAGTSRKESDIIPPNRKYWVGQKVCMDFL